MISTNTSLFALSVTPRVLAVSRCAALCLLTAIAMPVSPQPATGTVPPVSAAPAKAAASAKPAAAESKLVEIPPTPDSTATPAKSASTNAAAKASSAKPAKSRGKANAKAPEAKPKPKLPPGTYMDGGTQSITMVQGEVTSIPLKGKPVRVAVGNAKLVMSTVLEDNNLLLMAEAAGETNILIWTEDSYLLRFSLKVLAQNMAEPLANVTSLLRDIPGLAVNRIGDNLVISGELGKADMARLDLIKGQYPQVLVVARESKKEEDIVPAQMVYLKVHIMEMSKSAIENLGVQWGNTATGPGVAIQADGRVSSAFRYPQAPFFDALVPPLRGAAGRASFGLTTVLQSTLNLLVSNGQAFILATPELATRSGSSAKFLAGGEFPIRVVTGLGQATVSFKEYGIKLDIDPIADSKGNVTAKVAAEVSTIDRSVAVEGTPGLLTRRTESAVDMRSGQTMVISNLVDTTTQDDLNKFPFLGDLPVLGALFRSNNFIQRRSDLVIFVTPMVAGAGSPEAEKRMTLRRDWELRYNTNQQRRDLPMLPGEQPPPAAPNPAPAGAPGAAPAAASKVITEDLPSSPQTPEAAE